MARKLGLSGAVLAEAQGVLDDNGAALLTLKLDRDDVAALTTVRVRAARDSRGRAATRPARGVVPARVLAVSGGNEDSAAAILVR